MKTETKGKPQKAEPQKAEPQKAEPQKAEPQKGEAQKGEAQKAEPQRETTVRVLGDTKAMLERVRSTRGASSFDELLYELASEELAKSGDIESVPPRGTPGVQLLFRRLRSVEDAVRRLGAQGSRAGFGSVSGVSGGAYAAV